MSKFETVRAAVAKKVGELSGCLASMPCTGYGAADCRCTKAITLAAIQALREPSEAMLVAAVDGAGRMPPLSEDMDFTEVWRAMIDAALAEVPSK